MIRTSMPETSNNETLSKPDRQARLAAAMDSHTSPKTLLKLAADPDREIRANVARNPNTPPPALTQLAVAEDSDYYTLEMVAANPNTPEETLELLAGFSHDSQWQIRMGVASNPRAPSHLLIQLAEDENEWVRYYVRENANTPAEWKQRLANDPIPEEYQRFLDD